MNLLVGAATMRTDVVCGLELRSQDVTGLGGPKPQAIFHVGSGCEED